MARTTGQEGTIFVRIALPWTFWKRGPETTGEPWAPQSGARRCLPISPAVLTEVDPGFARGKEPTAIDDELCALDPADIFFGLRSCERHGSERR